MRQTTFLTESITLDGSTDATLIVGPDNQPAISILLASAGSVVTLRNLTIVAGAGGQAIAGALCGSVVNLENVMVVGDPSLANAIDLQLDSASQANLKDVTVTQAYVGINLSATNWIKRPFQALLDHVTACGAVFAGLQVQNGNVTVRNSTFRDCFYGIAYRLPSRATTSLIENSELVDNASCISVAGPVTVRLKNSVLANDTREASETSSNRLFDRAHPEALPCATF